MPTNFRGLIACAVLAVLGAVPASGAVFHISRAEDLEKLLSTPLHGVEIRLAPGEYHITPRTGVDQSCGNCEMPDTLIPMTYGLHVRGDSVSIIGPADRSAVIHTHAGYGVYFDGCTECALENVSVTGGVRDADGRATDAAVVVRDGTVRIAGNRIFDNIGDSTVVAKTVVGIMGICGRENARIAIDGNDIVRNSWDGIALYREASAVITGNLIDGVDKATGARNGGGRGVAIGLTWNAFADVRGNLVKRYWKGIGVFVDAWGCVQENVIEDIVTWGIAYWDADKGKPAGFFEDNVIYGTGACGVSIAVAATVSPSLECRFVRNVLVKTAQNPKYDDAAYYCYQTALALHAMPAGFVIADNLFYDNRRATDDLQSYDMERDEFFEKLRPVCERLSKSPLLGRSDFVRDFCAR
jgi:putative cofactor-binding repeat protein